MATNIFETQEVVGRSLAQSIRDVLRDAILQGELRPDQRIFEVELAGKLKVSRTPLREALRLLEAERIVQYSPHGGVTVRAFSVDEIREIFELRWVLEGYAAERAVDHLTRDQLLQLRENCDKFEAVLRREDIEKKRFIYQLVELNNEFHQAIAHASGNHTLEEIFLLIMTVPLVYRNFNWYSEEWRWRSLQTHRAILEALENHDGNLAQQRMRQHLRKSEEYIVQHLQEDLQEELLGNHSP